MGQTNVNGHANAKCWWRLAIDEVKDPFSVIGVLAFPKPLQTGMAALARVSFGFTCGNAHRDHKLWHSKYPHHCVQLIVRCSAPNS